MVPSGDDIRDSFVHHIEPFLVPFLILLILMLVGYIMYIFAPALRERFSFKNRRKPKIFKLDGW